MTQIVRISIDDILEGSLSIRTVRRAVQTWSSRGPRSSLGALSNTESTLGQQHGIHGVTVRMQVYTVSSSSCLVPVGFCEYVSIKAVLVSYNLYRGISKEGRSGLLYGVLASESHSCSMLDS